MSRLIKILSFLSGGAFLAALAVKDDTKTGEGGGRAGLPSLPVTPAVGLGPFPSSAAGVASTVVQFLDRSLPRGIRNNNPGNVRISSDPWRGKINGPDEAFETFDTPENGIRAAGKLLLNYQRIYGLNTIRAILNRYAPPSENDTGSYANAIAARLGISPDTPIDVREQLPNLLPAIIQHENGQQPYTQAQIADAISRI